MDRETLARRIGPAAEPAQGDGRSVPRPSGNQPPSIDETQLAAALRDLRRSFTVDLRDGTVAIDDPATLREVGAHVKYVPACLPEDLGDPGFSADHRLRFPYLAGAMANGIGSADIVEAMGRAGMLAFFGAAGLSLPTIEAAI